MTHRTSAEAFRSRSMDDSLGQVKSELQWSRRDDMKARMTISHPGWDTAHRVAMFLRRDKKENMSETGAASKITRFPRLKHTVELNDPMLLTSEAIIKSSDLSAFS